MNAVDAALVELLEATGLDVNEAYVDTENEAAPGTQVVVKYDLPYLVYYSNLGDDHFEDARLDGRARRRSIFFSITYVGETDEQAKAAGEKARKALSGKRITVDGKPSWLITCEVSQRVRRDDDAVTVDGTPLYYGVDEYATSIQITPEVTPA